MSRCTPLRIALAANAVFSLSTGLLLLIDGAPLANALGDVAPWMLESIGASLLLFAGLVIGVATRPRAHWALAVSVLDIGWVVGTLPLCLVPGLLTPFGTWAVAGVAGIVGALATGQLASIRYLVTDPDPAHPAWRHRVVVDVDAPADEMWALIADLPSIAQYAETVATSAMRDDAPVGVGAVRTCSNPAGDRWAEQVEHFDPDTRDVAFRFMEDGQPFPFPAHRMLGGWRVVPTARGSRVEVWFSLDPTVPVLPWAVVPLLGAGLDPSMTATIRRMANGTPTGSRGPRGLRTLVPC